MKQAAEIKQADSDDDDCSMSLEFGRKAEDTQDMAVVAVAAVDVNSPPRKNVKTGLEEEFEDDMNGLDAEFNKLSNASSSSSSSASSSKMKIGGNRFKKFEEFEIEKVNAEFDEDLRQLLIEGHGGDEAIGDMENLIVGFRANIKNRFGTSIIVEILITAAK